MSDDDKWSIHIPSWIRSAGIWGGILLLMLGALMVRIRLWGDPFAPPEDPNKPPQDPRYPKGW